MAIFTTADRDAIKTAMVTLAVEGVVSVSIAGQQVTSRNLDELRRLLEMINADLSASNAGMGLRYQKLRPPPAG